jgi:branched-chain amino acid transport system permease protein
VAVTALTRVPIDTGADVVQARDISLRAAVRMGLLGGVTSVFVSAIGMVQEFNERELIGGLTLGRLLLLAIPFVFGYVAGKPPPALEGFAAPRVGLRNVLAGAIAGILTGAVMVAFCVFIYNFDVRDTFINITPQLVRTDPRILTYGLDIVPGSAVILATSLVAGALGGAIHLLAERWRRALLTAVFTVISVALLAPLVQQILRGIQDVTNILTEPLDDFLYEPNGAMSIVAAIVVGAVTFGLSVLIRRRQRKPMRQRVEALPVSRRRIVYIGALAVLLLLLGTLPQILGTFLASVFNTAGIFLMMALGLNIVVGFAGLLDLGYVAFFAVGAYTTALLTAPNSSLGWNWVFWAAVPFVLLASAVAGIMVGTPVLRMRGDYLAIVTLGFGEIARILFISDWLEPIFGGAQGIVGVPDMTIGPIDFGSEEVFLYAVLVFILLATYVSYSLQGSRWGRAWMAMREDEAVSEALGVNTVAAKLLAFLTGALLAGLGGALFATKVGSVFPHSFDIVVSITVLVVIIVGGIASVPGVILGAFVLVALPELLREFEEFRFLIYGALLIFMMLRRPEGFIPSRRRAQELHEEEVMQDAWLHARAEALGGDAAAPAPVGAPASEDEG